jgi:hypothetical protein
VSQVALALWYSAAAARQAAALVTLLSVWAHPVSAALALCLCRVALAQVLMAALLLFLQAPLIHLLHLAASLPSRLAAVHQVALAH